MDNRRFDALTRAVASAISRRQLVKGALGLGGAFGSSGLREAQAARRPTPTPTPHSCPGMQLWNGTACVCPDELVTCGPDCCVSEIHCCGNACCGAGSICVGEETCQACPTCRTFERCDVEGPEQDECYSMCDLQGTVSCYANSGCHYCSTNSDCREGWVCVAETCCGHPTCTRPCGAPR